MVVLKGLLFSLFDSEFETTCCCVVVVVIIRCGCIATDMMMFRVSAHFSKVSTFPGKAVTRGCHVGVGSRETLKHFFCTAYVNVGVCVCFYTDVYLL